MVFFKTVYEITDGQYCYGIINYAGRFDGYSILKTMQDTFTIKRMGTFDRSLLIYNAKGENIALINQSNLIQLNNGFVASLLPTGSFTRGYNCINIQSENIFSTKESSWNYKKPFQ